MGAITHLNRYLFELLRRIEEGTRRLASTVTHNADEPLREMLLIQVELEEITNAFKTEVAAGASVGAMPGRLIKKEGSQGAIYCLAIVTGCLLSFQAWLDENDVQRSSQNTSQHQNQ